MEELIEQLAGYVEKNIQYAQDTRETKPKVSFFFWKEADLMMKAASGLKRNIPQEMDTEGEGSNWWYVCPECHGAIDHRDRFCRHCGQAVK